MKDSNWIAPDFKIYDKKNTAKNGADEENNNINVKGGS